MRHRHFHGLASVMGAIVWSIGMIVLIGYLFNFPRMQNWLGNEPMSNESAIAFVITGVTLFLLTIQREK